MKFLFFTSSAESPKNMRVSSKYFGSLVLLLALLTRLSYMQKILDTRLIGSPKIICEESRIRLSIRTNEPFGGNVYAKGFFNKDICRVRGNGVGNSANITIPVAADCGMRRRRIVDPKGLVLEMTIVLMFHGKFLTRNDKAYHIECVYMEISQKVTNRLAISAIPSTQLSESVSLQNGISSLPKCKYEVLNKDKNGEAISFAAIGHPVYHKWTCQGQVSNNNNGYTDDKLYCLTVHSCEVDDGQGNVQKLLDSNGCPYDRSLLDEVEYHSDLEAGRRGYVFKFADRPTVYFGCQLRLELKPEWKQNCRRTSEKCRSQGVEAEGALSSSGASSGSYDDLVPASNGLQSNEGNATGYETQSTLAPDEDENKNVSDFPKPPQSMRASPVTTVAPSTTSTAKDSSELYKSDKEEDDIVEVPLIGPSSSGSLRSSQNGESWRTYNAQKSSRIGSKEVAPSILSKESSALSSNENPAPNPATYSNSNSSGDYGYENNANGRKITDGEAGDEPPGSAPSHSNQNRNTNADDGSNADPEDDATALANDAVGVPQQARLRDAILTTTKWQPVGDTTLLLKRRRTTKSTSLPNDQSRRLTHFDTPIQNEKNENEFSVVQEFRLKRPRHFDSINVNESIEGPTTVNKHNSADHDGSTVSVTGKRTRPPMATVFPDHSQHGAFIDIDVTAPEVDVFDVPQIPVIHSRGNNAEDLYEYVGPIENMKIRDLSLQSSPNQLCISHQILSISLFLSSVALLGLLVGSYLMLQKFRQQILRSHRRFYDLPSRTLSGGLRPEKGMRFPYGPSSVGLTCRDENLHYQDYDESEMARRRTSKSLASRTLHNSAHSSATIA